MLVNLPAQSKELEEKLRRLNSMDLSEADKVFILQNIIETELTVVELKKKNELLIRDSAELERLVRERTKAISQANRKLEREIEERRKAEDELKQVAYNDFLTGLKNRKSFYESFQDSLNQAKRAKHDTLRALLFIDLDKFKEVNDTLGHEAGDQLLVEVAGRLRYCVRETDYVFRIGGDEFTTILNNISDPANAQHVAEKIVIALNRPYYLLSEEAFIGASIGIAIYPTDGEDVEALVRKADMAMYRAKETQAKFQYYSTMSRSTDVGRQLGTQNGSCG